MDYAPIIIFGYNRADMLKKLLESLEKNRDLDKMILYIFLDIPGKKHYRRNQYLSQRVIAYVNDYKKSSKFKKVTVKIAEEHKGLANSIIQGVTEVIRKHGRAIILEDDLLVSNDFLDYMQRALEFYKKDKKIWSISAHCPAMESLASYQPDVFIAPRAESLGWGTWRNRWDHMDWALASYKKFRKDLMGRILFNLGGNDLCKALERQMTDPEYDSWAIRWSYQQFRERKYTVYPKESRVVHCGNDSRSTHGSYYSTQGLKTEYKRCRFQPLRFDYKVVREFRKKNSVPLTNRIKAFILKH